MFQCIASTIQNFSLSPSSLAHRECLGWLPGTPSLDFVGVKSEDTNFLILSDNNSLLLSMGRSLCMENGNVTQIYPSFSTNICVVIRIQISDVLSLQRLSKWVMDGTYLTQLPAFP